MELKGTEWKNAEKTCLLPEAYMDVDLYNEVMFEVHHCPYSMRSVLLKP